MTASRRAIIAEALHKTCDFSARREVAVESTAADAEKGIS
jgi:hypothetical protein